MTSPVTLDVVIPVFNEAEMLDLLLARLQQVFAPAAQQAAGLRAVQFIFVDDGSTDRTAAMIAERIQAGVPATLLRFSRNFGHQNAVSAGLAHSRADYVAVIDADLQDPPEVVLAMLGQCRAGYEVVYGVRRSRQESLLKRLGYWGFYRLVTWLSETQIPLDSGDFSVISARVRDVLNGLPEQLRFPRILRAWVGFRQTGFPYDRPARQAGVAKYNFAKLYRLATDGIAEASTRPLRLFVQTTNLLFGTLTLLLSLLALTAAVTHYDLGIPVLHLLGLALLMASNTVLGFSLYILGAYVGRTYWEVKGRPAYVVMEVIPPRATTPGAVHDRTP